MGWNRKVSMASTLGDEIRGGGGGGETKNQRAQKERAVLADGPELRTFTAWDHLVLLLFPPRPVIHPPVTDLWDSSGKRVYQNERRFAVEPHVEGRRAGMKVPLLAIRCLSRTSTGGLTAFTLSRRPGRHAPARCPRLLKLVAHPV